MSEEEQANGVTSPSIESRGDIHTSTPKVYMDEAEFYVSSEEVRIGDKSWKLEDVEYISVEYNGGIITHSILFVLFMAIMMYLLIYVTQTTGAMVVGGILIMAISSLSGYSSAIYDNTTGYTRILVYALDNKYYEVRFAGYSRYRFIAKRFSKAFNRAASDKLYAKLHPSGDIPGNTSRRSSVRNVHLDRESGTAYLFNMEMPIVSIRNISLNDSFFSSNISIATSRGVLAACAFALTTVVFVLYEIKYSVEALIYMMVVYDYIIHALVGQPLVLNINFQDGSLLAVNKWLVDDKDGALKQFADEYQKYKREQKVAARRERKLKRAAGG